MIACVVGVLCKSLGPFARRCLSVKASMSKVGYTQNDYRDNLGSKEWDAFYSNHVGSASPSSDPRSPQ